MRIVLLNIWEDVSASFWFLPGLILAAVLVLAQISLSVDARLDVSDVPFLRWMVIEDPSSAQTILSTVAASMITVTGAVFSITIVALTVAANQFGQRLLRNFIRDRGNQTTMGVFLGTFVYSLYVMRSVSTLKDFGEVPSVSVCGAITLALVSVLVLIYFIHHVAYSIQAENVVATVAHDFDRMLENLYPRRGGEDCGGAASDRLAAQPVAERESGIPVKALQAGYIQAVDYARLAEQAEEWDALLEVRTHPGAFVFEHTVIVKVHDADSLAPERRKRIRQAFFVGDQATHEQDIAYSIRQLAQIGVRALSPGINDPYTAYVCINRLGAMLGRLLNRPPPLDSFKNEEGVLRVVHPVASFADLASVALDEIIEYGHKQAVVVSCLLQMIAGLAPECGREDERLVLWRHARRCAELGLKHVEDDATASAIRARLEGIRGDLLVAGGRQYAGET